MLYFAPLFLISCEELWMAEQPSLLGVTRLHIQTFWLLSLKLLIKKKDSFSVYMQEVCYIIKQTI